MTTGNVVCESGTVATVNNSYKSRHNYNNKQYLCHCTLYGLRFDKQIKFIYMPSTEVAMQMNVKNAKLLS